MSTPIGYDKYGNLIFDDFEGAGGSPYEPLMSVDPLMSTQPQEPAMLQTAAPQQSPMAPPALGAQPEQQPALPLDKPQENPMLSPEANAAQERVWLHDMGLERVAPRAPKAEMWLDKGRAGAIPDFTGPEREALAARNRGLVRDEEAVMLAENELDREFLRRRTAEQRGLADQEEARVAGIRDEVARRTAEFDTALAQQRELFSKGIRPYAALSPTGSNAGGKMIASMSMGLALALGDQNTIEQTAHQIDRAINTEMDKQKTEADMAMGNVQNAYTFLRDKYGDEEQARAQLKALLLDAAKAEAEEMAAASGDPRANLWAQQMLAKIDAEQLAAKDAFMARAYGTVTEQKQHFDPGSAGGIRPMSTKDFQSWRKGRTGEAATQATTQKTLAGIGKGDAKSLAQQRLERVPPDARKEFSKTLEVSQAIAAVANQLGMRYDPDTGELSGEPGDIPGRGPLDSLKRGIPKVGSFDPGATDKEVNAMVGNIVDTVNRNFSGQSYTDSEFRRRTARMDSNLDEGTVIAGMKDLARMIAAQQRAVIDTQDEDAQREALSEARARTMGGSMRNQNLEQSVGAVPIRRP
jgi:hypothetical protein